MIQIIPFIVFFRVATNPPSILRTAKANGTIGAPVVCIPTVLLADFTSLTVLIVIGVPSSKSFDNYIIFLISILFQEFLTQMCKTFESIRISNQHSRQYILSLPLRILV